MQKTNYVYDRDKWLKEQDEKLEAMHNSIKQIADGYKSNPETIAELLEFRSKFYQYSTNNNILIRSQNPNATFVSSYQGWKQKGYQVQAGQKGMSIFVPVQAEVFTPISSDKGEDGYKKVVKATPEEIAKIKSGEIKTRTMTRFNIGNVFDISQTDCPVNEYPKFYHMGYSSKDHSEIYNEVKKFAESMDIAVSTEDFKSIALRGRYFPSENHIEISDKLNDTEKLSTLTHELGHALMHKDSIELPTEVKEYEADCISIMLQSKYGIELTDSRKEHLANHYKLLDKDFDWMASMKRIETTYSQVINNMETIKERPQENSKPPQDTRNNHVSTYAPIEEKTHYSTTSIKKKPLYDKDTNKELYENIKHNVDIVELSSYLGYTPVKEGSVYSLKEHDSIKIYPKTNSFARFSEQGSNGKFKGGSVIDFVMELNGFTLQESIELLKQKINLTEYNTVKRNAPPAEKQEVATPFVLPEKTDGQYNRAFAYLTKTRSIDPQVVSEMVKQKYIYEDKRHNVVFCGKDKDDKIVYATKRSTATDSKYRGDVAGSNQEVGVFVNNKASKMIVNEAFIDSLSYMTLMKLKGRDYHNVNFLALGGISPKPVIHHLKENEQIIKIIIATDNDTAGKKTASNIKSMVEDFSNKTGRKISIETCVPHEKDFNEDLKNVRNVQEKKLQPSNSKAQQYEMER